MKVNLGHIVFVVCLLFFLSACNVTKYLGGDESFLVENEIIVLKDKELSKNEDINADLNTLFLQKPNDKFLGIPKQYYYYKYSNESDTTRFKQWIREQFGQVPVIFNDSTMESTAINISNYLHSRGYFEAEVQGIKIYKDKKGQKLKARYEIAPGKPYVISDLVYSTRDTTLEKYLDLLESSSFLSPGQRLDETLYNQEIQRISQVLKDEGYALFGTHFIDKLKVDSTEQEFKVSLDILSPSNALTHKKYVIGEITIFPDYDPSINDFVKKDSTDNGIQIIQQNQRLIIRKDVLKDAIAFKTGDIYSQTKFNQTNRKLGQLEMYGFVNIKKELDPDQANTLNIKIYLTPNKRFAFGANGELNISKQGTANTSFLRLFGISSNVSLQHRNFLKGAELFITGLEAGMALNLKEARDSLVNNLDIHANMDIYYPKFVDYLGIFKGLNKLNLLSDKNYNGIKRNTKTHLGISYDNILNFQFYSLHSFNTKYGYEITSRKNRLLNIDMLGLDFFNPKIEDQFNETVISQNAYLASSFTKQFFTGFLFRDFTYQYKRLVPKYGESRTFGFGLEVSGLEILGLNALYNSLKQSGDDVIWKIQTKDEDEEFIEFSQYLKSYFSYTYTKKYTNKTSFAFRMISGIAKPVGFSNAIPFVKQFYVGGPESMRGWLIRSIGPGGVIPESEANSFVQSGDIHIELNFEYRLPLFSLGGINYETALFFDMGNVWLLYDDSDRPNAQLTWNNFKNYNAVNSGIGLRIDFTYFILRVDAGIRLRNPYPTLEDNQEYFWVKPGEILGANNKANFNLALGYPF